MEDDFFQSALTSIIDENYSNAIDYLTKILSKNENDYKALLYRGVALQKKGEYDNALTDYNKAEKLRGENQKDDFYYLRALAHFYNQDLELAKNDLNKMLQGEGISDEVKEKVITLMDKINMDSK